jgi:multidrug efflux pump subunit AcrB
VESFPTLTRLDAKPCTTLLIYQSAGANPRDTTKAIRDRLKDFAKTLPQGIEYQVLE